MATDRNMVLYGVGDTVIKSELFIGKCQCCSSESASKSMFLPFEYEGNHEIYSEMLRACFSIELIDNGDNEDNYLICDGCILSLRNGCFFRKQVISAQERVRHEMFESEIGETKTEYKEDLSYSSEDDKASIFENVFKPELGETIEISFKKSKHRTKVSKKHKGLNKKVKKKKRYLSNLKSEEGMEICTNDNIIKHNKSERIILSKLPKEEILQHRRIAAKRREELVTPYKLDKSMRCCPLCNEEFTMHKNLIMHMNIHYPNFVCYHCGKAFARKRQLQAHLPRHSDPLIACNTCGKKIKRYNMRRHLMTHTGNLDIHCCPSCPERFKNYGLRQNHIAKFHNEEAPKHKCKLCPKVYCMASTLSTHVRKNHLNERKHCCTECDKNFFEKTELENHMRIHTGEMFKCGICSKGYPRKSKLTAHMKIHDVPK